MSEDSSLFKGYLIRVGLSLSVLLNINTFGVVMSFPPVLNDRLILLSFLEQKQIAAVYLNKKNWDSLETSRRAEKLSPSEIKVRSSVRFINVSI